MCEVENLGAVAVEFTPDELREIDSTFSTIKGARPGFRKNIWI